MHRHRLRGLKSFQVCDYSNITPPTSVQHLCAPARSVCQHRPSEPCRQVCLVRGTRFSPGTTWTVYLSMTKLRCAISFGVLANPGKRKDLDSVRELPNGQNRHVEGYTTARQLCVNAPTTAHVEGYTTAKQSESTCGGVHYGQTVIIDMWMGTLRPNGQNRHVEGYTTA